MILDKCNLQRPISKELQLSKLSKLQQSASNNEEVSYERLKTLWNKALKRQRDDMAVVERRAAGRDANKTAEKTLNKIRSEISRPLKPQRVERSSSLSAKDSH